VDQGIPFRKRVGGGGQHEQALQKERRFSLISRSPFPWCAGSNTKRKLRCVGDRANGPEMGEIDAVIEMKFFFLSPSYRNEAIPFRLLFGGSQDVSFSITAFHLEGFMCSCSFTIKEGAMAAAMVNKETEISFLSV